MTPLYAVLNIEWAPQMFYPQPRAQLQQQTTYLDLMTRAARQGRRPERAPHAQDLVHAVQLRSAARRRGRRDAVLARGLRQRHRGDEAAAASTAPIRRSPTIKPSRGRVGSGDADRDAQSTTISGLPPVPTGGPGIPPLLAAAGAGYGEGFAANAHRFAPTGMLAAVQVSRRGAARRRQRARLTTATPRSTTPRRAATTR